MPLDPHKYGNANPGTWYIAHVPSQEGWPGPAGLEAPMGPLDDGVYVPRNLSVFPQIHA